MRTLLIAFVLIFSSFSVQSQNYVPFPDSAAVWVNATLVVNQSFDGDYICANGNDTLINATSYTIFEECISGTYRGAFRDTLGKVYIVPKDSTNEYLLYDFYALPGDTLVFYQEEFGAALEEYVVQPWDTGSVQVNGGHRKTVQVGDGRWIEGIGSDKGLFTSQFGNVSNYAIWLYCMSVQDTVQYGYSVSFGGWAGSQQVINLSCDFYLNQDELAMTKVDVYPNPASELVIFTIPGNVENVELIDQTGRVMRPKWNFSSGQYYISVGELPRGMYIVKITEAARVYRTVVVLN
ncbi:MAG: T9SS type A sorting domain-containing protein [bacterium]|nr:T9SS type A sorting domain-containing protein [bacterium]